MGCMIQRKFSAVDIQACPSIDILTKYKRYIASKPWVCDNYLSKNQIRKPDWL